MNISNVYFTKRKTLILGMQLSAPGMYIFPQNLVQPSQNSGFQKGAMKQLPYPVLINIRCHQKKKLVATATLRLVIRAPVMCNTRTGLSDNHIDTKLFSTNFFSLYLQLFCEDDRLSFRHLRKIAKSDY